ncbi:glycosyltransferase family 2 protein [Lusitaniella coriacea]|uniref:glycosyltransferase family 2 protein n=1 Tax=Lusitaniella coriacea TaxID=1983105 RepID=UPI003CF43298
MHTFSKPLPLTKEILIYIPCYNCEDTVVSVLRSIPQEFWDRSECLVIDNCSEDKTSEAVLEEIQREQHPFPISLLRTQENIGYAGSQKLAYQLALNSPQISQVVMLHGDSQYPPSLLLKLLPHINSGKAIVNGYRDKSLYPNRDETPWSTYLTIKILNTLENLVTGMNQKEWHSGFAMYSRHFLEQVPFHSISNTYHIDGEMLIVANSFKLPILSVPIYKHYEGKQRLLLWGRIKYTFTVFKLLFKYRSKKLKYAKREENSKIPYAYDVLSSPTQNITL